MSKLLPGQTDPFKDLPDFQNISAADIAPLVDALLLRLEERLETLTQQHQYTFDTLVHPHEELLHDLMRSWSPIAQLNNVCQSDEWQTAYLDGLAKITRFSTRLSQDAAVFSAYEDIASTLPGSDSAQKKRLLQHTLRAFRLAGIALDDDGKARFRALMQQLSAAQATFASNLQRCTDQWHWHTTEDLAVAGIPKPVLNQAREAAQANHQQGWLFNLTQPVYQAVMSHAASRDTRELFYTAWMTRASDQGEHDAAFDNSTLLRDILAARIELAELLGFETFADYSLAAKMAGSVKEVIEFLTDLCARSRSTAERELAALESLAAHPLAPWDVSYYVERLKKREHAVSDEDLRPYFPINRVLCGLFELAQRLYGIRLKQRDDIGTWHEDVDFLEVFSASGERVGGFYTDLFARSGKRGGAWVDECVIRKSLGASSALPVGYLVCNFTPASKNAPALLAHHDVVTLFHEFGHMLHHLLTRVDYPSIAGLNGVPWDAVELPSQFMENFAWQFDVLQTCSGHYRHGEPLPRKLFDSLLAARNLGAGLQMLRQLEFSLFDFQLHARSDAASEGVVAQTLRETRQVTALVQIPEWSRFENSFSHVFAGGYEAGYYSYKWAEVLAADAFSAFDEAGSIFDQDVAKRFREHILEIGGSRDIQHAYVEFRGREPRIDALLVNNGIIAA